ncbi:MAG: DEAD/DEAH box helicase [Spirochaetes bacterium]|nr:DEAD/DEAH box helicase [Spirochaetota bacterium]
MSEDIRTQLNELQADPTFMDCVTHWERIPPREGVYADLPADLHPTLRRALEDLGISRLYSHQEKACRIVRDGKHLLIVTPTASGKTLCYNLPVLQSILEDPGKRALYLFPTKALSQDQQASLNVSILTGRLPVKVMTYDGDTPASLRTVARETGQIIISNPDMLHSGILPNHPKWIKFFRTLSFVVIDEIHIYRGVFGSHMANVIRRLKRICSFYGVSPLFICSSATIGNPLELGTRIVEEQLEVLAEHGAPMGEKHIILYNPPLVDRVQGIRRGVVLESERLAVRFLKAGIKTIVFARSRIHTELIATYIRGRLQNVYTDNHRIRVESYRGGYLPLERRTIEEGLRNGTVQGVVATNALELGIDIGGLDVAILAGFPGSISSAWQQAGRAGRRQGVSLAILVASSSPLDQFMVKNPDYFFGRSPEEGFLDPENPYIYTDHVRCTVFELPLRQEEAFGKDVVPILDQLEELGTIRRTQRTYYWSDRSYPAEGVSLRSASSENVVILDITGGRNRVIGEMDRPSAKELLFPNAVYLHRGLQYMVKHLDLEQKRAEVEEVEVNYYTDAIVKRDLKVLLVDEETEGALFHMVVGDILVRSQVTKFKKIRFHSHETIGYGELSLPEEEMHTRSCILVFGKGTKAGEIFQTRNEEEKTQILLSLGTVYRQIAPFYLLCEPRDIGVSERLRDPHFGEPALYFFDQYPGGTGLAESFKKHVSAIHYASAELIRSCPCAEGCPSCIGPRDPQREVTRNPKEVTLRYLAELDGMS